ncbi:DUF4083 family protein [Metabacillus fastidiosus]|uniref:DUF4083 family protein n=1 Tax=Metabacillus fastidiosus TaxID=1458 RepID=UPI003D2851D9
MDLNNSILQLFAFVLLAIIIIAIVEIVKLVTKKNLSQQSTVTLEKKLDRIIDLLEKDKNH